MAMPSSGSVNHVTQVSNAWRRLFPGPILQLTYRLVYRMLKYGRQSQSVDPSCASDPKPATPVLTDWAAALGYFVFDRVIDQAAEAATNHKDSEEVLCEFVRFEEHDLTVRVDETR